MIVRYRARALTDIEAIRQYIEERNPDGAQKVLRAIYDAVEFVAQIPRGSPEADSPGIRVKIIVGYPYKVFYMVRGDSIEILHVRHSARAPWLRHR
jgi:toxin ParE1/3/4